MQPKCGDSIVENKEQGSPKICIKICINGTALKITKPDPTMNCLLYPQQQQQQRKQKKSSGTSNNKQFKFRFFFSLSAD